MLSLRQMLEDPLFAATEPVVVAAADHLARPVRWVHASEKRDIAPLLLGGEVVLMEGLELGEGVSDAEHAEFVSSLVSARVAALALELTPRLPRVPAAVVEAAERLGLPVIAMHRRVPFVQLCQAVNTRLSDGSLQRLHVADTVSTALSQAALVSTGVEPLLDVVAGQVGAAVTLVATSGEEIASAGAGEDAGERCHGVALRAGDGVLASLYLRARRDADPALVAAALDRAPEVLSIRLLQERPPTAREALTAELFSLLGAVPARPEPVAGSLRQLQASVCLDRLLEGHPTSPWFLGVSAHTDGDWRVMRRVRELLLEVCSAALVHVVEDRLLALAPFAAPAELTRGRDALLARAPALVAGASVVCVGAGVQRQRLGREVVAVDTVRSWGPPGGGVVDVRDHAVRRLAQGLRQPGAEPAADVGDFVHEVLGELAHDRGELFRTLAAYASCWGSKTRTAAALGIGRQALYQRLARIEALVGPLDASADRVAALTTAVFLEQARRSLPRGI